MSGWSEFIVAFAVFLASHRVPSWLGLRGALIARFGEGVYVSLFSLFSLALFGWLIAAANRAPYVALWDFQPWQLWIVNLAMPIAILLAAFGAAASNPLSIAGAHPEAFDADAPGIAGVTRHPILWAFCFWAVGHLAPNGDLAHVLLFGASALFAVLGIGMVDRRYRRLLGEAEWSRLARRTHAVPLIALMTGRWRPRRISFSAARALIALFVYGALLVLHPAIIGVSPLPH